MTSTDTSVADFISTLPALEPPDFHYVQPEGQGSVFHEEGRILTKLASLVKDGDRALEIGAALGISSRYLLHGLGPACRLDSIDIVPRWRSNDYRYVQLVGLSSDYFPLEKCYSMAFVDGEHRYDAALTDILACLSSYVPLVVVHDTNTDNIAPSNGTMEGSDTYPACLAAHRDFPHYTLTHLKTHCGLSIFHHKGLL